jgi:hypothetical protein
MNNLTLNCTVKFGKVFDCYFSVLLQVSGEASLCLLAIRAHCWCAESAEVDSTVCL